MPGRDLGRVLLVDEFQDTDRIQSEILRLLGGEALFHGRMFVVGDAKQSIYRFRGAEPAIFGQWRGEFPRGGRLAPDRELPERPARDPLRQRPLRRVLRRGRPSRLGRGPRLVPIRRTRPGRPSSSSGPPPARRRRSERRSKPPGRGRGDASRGALARPALATRLDAGWTVVDRKTREIAPGARRGRRVPVPGHDRRLALRVGAGRPGVRLPHHRRLGLLLPSRRSTTLINVLSVVEDPLDEVALAGCLREPVLLPQRRRALLARHDVRGGTWPRASNVRTQIAELSPPDRPLALRAGDAARALARDQGPGPDRDPASPRCSTSRASRRPCCASSSARGSWPTLASWSAWRASSTGRGASPSADFVARLRADLATTRRARSRPRRPTRTARASA